MQQLSSARISLRQWRDEDYPAFAQLNGDPQVMKYFPAPLSRQQSNDLADRLRASIEKHGWGIWVVESIAQSELVGTVGLQHLSAEFDFSPGVEIAWRLARAHWGQGYATEAARLALEFAFTALALPEVVSFTTVSNTASRAVMERIGMHDTGHLFNHPKIPASDPLSEHVLYRLSASSYQLVAPR